MAEDIISPQKNRSAGIIVQFLPVFVTESSKIERELINRKRSLGYGGFNPCHAVRKRKREQTGGRRQPWMEHPALEVDWIDGEL